MSSEGAATVAGGVLIALDIVTVVGRFYSRWSTKAGFGWDDWTIVVALLTGILTGALVIWGALFSFVSPFPKPIRPDQILYRHLHIRGVYLHALGRES